MIPRLPLLIAVLIHTAPAIPAGAASPAGTDSSASPAGTAWQVDGFDHPESVLHDTDRGRLVVSEIRGAPDARDSDGGLALLSPDGAVIDRAWVTGMNAPKGLALLGDRLLVADLDRLHVLDAGTGQSIDILAPEGARFLNDVTVLDGAAYVTDLMTDTIWRYDGAGLAPWLTDARLSHPNGILAHDGGLVVAAWGVNLAPDFSTEAPGGLLRVDPVTRDIADLVPDLGNIDGIAAIEGDLIVSDWITGALIRVDPDGAARTVETYPAGLADISAEDGILYLPQMLTGRITARPIE